jgi:hypothetical protein
MILRKLTFQSSGNFRRRRRLRGLQRAILLGLVCSAIMAVFLYLMYSFRRL